MSSTKHHRHVVVMAVWTTFFRVALALTAASTAAKTSISESEEGTLMRHEVPTTGHQKVPVPGEHAALKAGHVLAEMAPEDQPAIPREEVEKLEMLDPENLEDVVDPVACKEQRTKQMGGVLLATQGFNSRTRFTPINCGENVASSCATCGPWNKCNGECEWSAPGFHYGSLDWKFRGICRAKPKPPPEEPGQITHPAPVLGDNPSQIKMDPCKRLEHALAPLVVSKHAVVTMPGLDGKVQMPVGDDSDDIVYGSSAFSTTTDWLKVSWCALGVCFVCSLCAIGGSVAADRGKVKTAKKERDKSTRRLQEEQEARQAEGAGAAEGAESEEDF